MRCIETRIYDTFEVFSDSDKLQHEMYWNLIRRTEERDLLTDKLQHEMYWNPYSLDGAMVDLADKLQHEMYWNICATHLDLSFL